MVSERLYAETETRDFGFRKWCYICNGCSEQGRIGAKYIESLYLHVIAMVFL